MVVVIGGRVIVVVVPIVNFQFKGSSENADRPPPSIHSTFHSYAPTGRLDTTKALVSPLGTLLSVAVFCQLPDISVQRWQVSVEEWSSVTL